MKKWMGKNSTEIIFGILLAMLGYIAACSWDTLTSLPQNYVQRHEFTRMEKTIDKINDNVLQLVKECNR